MRSSTDLTVDKAMAVLGLDPEFTMVQLKKQFIRASQLNDPDKGGSHDSMVEITKAWTVLSRTVVDLDTPTDQNEGWQWCVMTTLGPLESDIEAAAKHGAEFMDYLSTWPRSDSLHEKVMLFRNKVKQAATNGHHALLMDYGTEVTGMLAAHVNRQSAPRTWQAIGFKHLSYEGYDVTPNGLHPVDYGNCEYVVMLEFWCLERPALCTSLMALQRRWPVYLDLWKQNKSSAHVERLADIVEIIMGAARGEVFFKDIFTRSPYNDQLPQLFAQLKALCKLVQELNARLSSGYLKHKREHVPKFCGFDTERGLASLEFTRRWTGGNLEDKGLLFHALVCAGRDQH